MFVCSCARVLTAVACNPGGIVWWIAGTQMKGVMKDVARSTRGIVRVGYINCDEQGDFCGQQGVNSYATLRACWNALAWPPPLRGPASRMALCTALNRTQPETSWVRKSVGVALIPTRLCCCVCRVCRVCDVRNRWQLPQPAAVPGQDWRPETPQIQRLSRQPVARLYHPVGHARAPQQSRPHDGRPIQGRRGAFSSRRLVQVFPTSPFPSLPAMAAQRGGGCGSICVRTRVLAARVLFAHVRVQPPHAELLAATPFGCRWWRLPHAHTHERTTPPMPPHA